MKVRLIKLNSGETIISQIHLWGGKNDDMELLNPLMVIEDPSNFELRRNLKQTPRSDLKR